MCYVRHNRIRSTIIFKDEERGIYIEKKNKKKEETYKQQLLIHISGLRFFQLKCSEESHHSFF